MPNCRGSPVDGVSKFLRSCANQCLVDLSSSRHELKVESRN